MFVVMWKEKVVVVVVVVVIAVVVVVVVKKYSVKLVSDFQFRLMIWSFWESDHWICWEFPK